MSYDPNIVPKEIDTTQGEHIKDESANERDRRNGPFKPAGTNSEF